MPVRLEHANLTVRDIDAMIAFLQTIEPEFAVLHDSGPQDSYRWVHVGTPQGYFALEEPHEKDANPATREAYSDYGINHVGLVVSNVDAIAGRLRAAGYAEGYKAEVHPARIRRYFLDPTGCEWELVEYLTDNPATRFAYG